MADGLAAQDPSIELDVGVADEVEGDLEFVERRRPSGVEVFEWERFCHSDRFDEQWWNGLHLFVDEAIFLEVRKFGIEVARLEIDTDVAVDHYSGTEVLVPDLLEIQLIEVADVSRRQGIGRAVVRGLEMLYPDRGIVAFSEGADEFWSSLGWTRFDHPETDALYRPLFANAQALRRSEESR